MIAFHSRVLRPRFRYMIHPSNPTEYTTLHMHAMTLHMPPQNLDPLVLARYIVNPTYPPTTTTASNTTLIENHLHPPGALSPPGLYGFPSPTFPFSPLLLPAGDFFPSDRPSCWICRFQVFTATMSWLSVSSPVSALKPRKAGWGSLIGGVSKHSVHSSTASCWRSTRKEVSAK